MELPFTFKEKLCNNGPNCYLYKSKKYPGIMLLINNMIISAECNSIDIDPEIIDEWNAEYNGDLDNLLRRIDEECNEQAPGFNSEIKPQVYNELTFSHLKWNKSRQLVIYTWGKRHHKNKPSQSQCNFNAAVINGSREGLNLRKMTGLNIEVQKSVKAGVGYIKFMEFMINKIESNDLHIISINCSAGRHRCVSCAEILKQEFYPNAIIYHLDVSR